MNEDNGNVDEVNAMKMDKHYEFDSLNDEDAIDAYFKQRSNSVYNSLFKGLESDSDSSLGVLDLDKISILEEIDRLSLHSQNLQHDPTILSSKNLSLNAEADMSLEAKKIPCQNSNFCEAEPLNSELNLIKQRELAKKTLLDFKNRMGNITENKVLLGKQNLEQIKPDHEIKSIINHFYINQKLKNCFDYNQSPETPKSFKDELNSVSESSAETPVLRKVDSGRKMISTKEATEKTNKFNELINKSPPNDSHNKGISFEKLNASDLIFESQNAVEILNRLEEDEEKFIKEQSVLSNNSQISQFSGVTEDKFHHCLSTSVSPKEKLEHERISIGKYFELRSHSINSLIGPNNLNEDPATLNIEENQLSAFSSVKKTENNNVEYPTLTEEPFTWKKKNKRWHSSSYLNKMSDSPIKRHSNESSESTSTLLIQDLLCKMESGLSGTEINDRLIECLGQLKRDKNDNENEIIIPKCMETPKSSKTGVKRRSLESSCKGKLDHSEIKFPCDSTTTKKSIIIVGEKPVVTDQPKMISSEFKENMPKIPDNKNILPLKNKPINQKKQKNGFDSSTPKLETTKSIAQKYKSSHNQMLIKDHRWESPRVSLIRKPLNLNETLFSEEYEKTLTLNSTLASRKNNKKKDENTITMEDTIVLGDLTVFSERISEIEGNDSYNAVFSNNEKLDIKSIIKALAKYPKGSVDCSSLIPFLRDQFPEMQSIFSKENEEIMDSDTLEEFQIKIHETESSAPGSWVNMASEYGYKEKFYLPVDVKQLIFLPVKNLTKSWLIVSLESISIQHHADKYINGSNVNDYFIVGDFLSVFMKDLLISPEEISMSKIYVTSKISTTLQIKLKFCVKKIIEEESQFRELLINVIYIFPKENLTITPKNEIKFGIIAEECSDEKIFQIAFDGICHLPIKIFIDKSQNFALDSDVLLNGESIKRDVWLGNKFHYTLSKGCISILQFKVKFQPFSLLKGSNKCEMDVKETLRIALDVPNDENCVLHNIPISGCVGFAKFLCSPSCSPLIFRSSEINQPIERAFPLKNVGAIEIEFSIYVTSENSRQKDNDELFLVPKTFILPKEEERSFTITFTSKTRENYVKRFLILQMIPNGQILYDVELIGIVMPLPNSKSPSRLSSNSGPVSSIYKMGKVPFKLKTTLQSISWPAVPLDTEIKETFQIMNSSNCNAMARFSFRKETSTYKFINENGEVIEKLRKILKPNCSNVMNVVFRPQSTGPHKNAIIIETNNLSGKKMISLNGFGGSPKIFIRNLKSDLNGCKMIRLLNSEEDNQLFEATIEFLNKGNIAGFVSICTVMKVLSLNNDLQIEPSEFVIAPNTKVEVKICQKLKNNDIKRLLSGKDIGKLATVTVTTGDEPSRFRMRKLINEKKKCTSEAINLLLNTFVGEKHIDVDQFDDEKMFENVFIKNLETIEIAAIIERPTDICEPTILEDLEDTVLEFVTILPASDFSIVSESETKKILNSEDSSKAKFHLDKSNLSILSGTSSKCRDKKITRWLETLEEP